MNNKKKNILLLLGFVLALIACYQFAISKTIVLKREYDNLKQQKTVFQNLPEQMAMLKQKKHYYDSILSKYHLDESSVQNNLLKTINTFAGKNDLKVVGFLEPHLYQKNELTLKTYQFTLEGNFNPILKLIYQLEQKTKYGEIINLHFEKKENYRTGNEYLQAKVLLRSFG